MLSIKIKEGGGHSPFHEDKWRKRALPTYERTLMEREWSPPALISIERSAHVIRSSEILSNFANYSMVFYSVLVLLYSHCTERQRAPFPNGEGVAMSSLLRYVKDVATTPPPVR